MSKMKRAVAAVTALMTVGVAVAVLTVAPASAAIVSVSGDIVKIAPPPSAKAGQLESDTTMHAWDEKQDFTLPGPIDVDITQPGTYDETADLTPGTIPAGTVVRSHMIHADKVGIPGPSVTLEGSIVTDQPVIGIAVLQASLDGSDVLGSPGTAYPQHGIGVRRLSFENGNTQDDFVILQPDEFTVIVRSTTDAHFDQVRVITGPSETLGRDGCTPGYWKQKHHFDSWQGYAPTDSWEAVFGVDAFRGNPTMVKVLSTGGGGVKALGRASTAALLNAAHTSVDYAQVSSAIITQTRDAILSGDKKQIEALKNTLDKANNGGCGLN